jgi:hypothetical protein
MSRNQLEYGPGLDFPGEKTERNQGRHLIEIKLARSPDYSRLGGADVLGR